jgi:hypothetical protein
MNFGGSLKSAAIFKKILSIGYEFETNELAKLSLHANKKTLINSDTTLRTLQSRTTSGTYKVVDENYILARIPIGVDPKEIDKEYEVNLEEMDQDERDFWESNREDMERERLERRENETYLDYFYEYRKNDNRKTVKFNITNDLGDTPFQMMLKGYCEDLTTKKNDLYFFRTQSGRMLDIKFTEDIAKDEDCESFSGVEYVITYYSPKKENPNIIVDSFVDACSRIIDHLGDVKTIKGELLINDGKKELTPVGAIEDNRGLYHKPGTNLFYMDTYDSMETYSNNTLRLKGIQDVAFVPQMTFRCNAIDAVDIILEIMRKNNSFTVGKSTIRDQHEQKKDLVFLKEQVEYMFSKYNGLKTTKLKINGNEGTGKILKTYLFLIFKKVYMFIDKNDEIISGDKYLKDTLLFASRHPNIELFARVKQILSERYKITAFDDILNLICHPSIMREFYGISAQKYSKTAHIDDLPDTDPNYGNPLYSMRSYFRYLEKKEEDWLKVEKYDVYSTTFEIKSDIILLENRYFRYAIGLYLRNMLDENITKESVTVKDMHKIVNHFYKDKIRNMATLKRDPKKNVLTRKSNKEEGSYISLGKARRSVKKVYKKVEPVVEAVDEPVDEPEVEHVVEPTVEPVVEPEVEPAVEAENEPKISPRSLTRSTRRSASRSASRNHTMRNTPRLTQ